MLKFNKFFIFKIYFRFAQSGFTFDSRCTESSSCTFIFSSTPPPSTIYLYWIQVCTLYKVHFMYIYILLFSSPFNHLIVLDPGMYRVHCILYSLWTCIFSTTAPPSTIHWYVYDFYSPLFLPNQSFTCTGTRYLHCIIYSVQFMYIYILSIASFLPYICTGLRSVSAILRIPEFLHNFM